jgi:hypothetical protein
MTDLELRLAVARRPRHYRGLAKAGDSRGVERTEDRSDQRRGIDLVELEPGDGAC